MAKKTKSLTGLGKKPKEHYDHVIEGIYGKFQTPAGPVEYLQTKARLGSDNTTNGKLIKQLIPAREALNIEEMDFNELLQRDLDDHRIATKLIDYIINPPKNGLPGFFPPILAILLPFDEKQNPVDSFPKPKKDIQEDDRYGLSFSTATHEGYYKAQFAYDPDANEPHEIPLGVVSWNSNRAKLVVIDGQHRAMALLAIERTITNSWDQSGKGARYKPFYIEHIESSLKAAGIKKVDFDFSKIELPVNICWFANKDTSSELTKCHLAARKLFVDVNNNAKPPSESRLILLSDTQLDNILTRDLLNRLRKEKNLKDEFPLYAVEYDNPDRNSSNPKRWSVVTSLDILKDAVIRTGFGPPKVIKDLNASLQGKVSISRMDERFRDQLQIDSLFPDTFNDGDRSLRRDQIGNSNFPINDKELHKKLLDRYFERWGSGILHLLSNIEPFKAHIEALKDSYDCWEPADNKSILAKDALFEGVGMLWTIEDAHNLWLEKCREAKQELKPKPERPDISKAWHIIHEDQKPGFQKRRCELYLGAQSDDLISDSENLYTSLVTYAAQIGLVLAWATLHEQCSKSKSRLDVAKALTRSINKTLVTGPTKNRDRRRILLKKSSVAAHQPLNMLPRLQPMFAMHYRYFWLELALHSEGVSHLSKTIDVKKAKALLEQARHNYICLLIEERKKIRKRDSDLKDLPLPDQNQKATDRATDEIKEEQANAHKYWFGLKISDAKKLIESTLKSQYNSSNNITEQEEDDAEAEDPDQI